MPNCYETCNSTGIKIILAGPLQLKLHEKENVQLTKIDWLDHV